MLTNLVIATLPKGSVFFLYQKGDVVTLAKKTEFSYHQDEKEEEENEMARPQSKNDLLQESQKNWDKLWELLEKIDSEGITTTLDFSDEPKRTQAHSNTNREQSSNIFVQMLNVYKVGSVIS